MLKSSLVAIFCAITSPLACAVYKCGSNYSQTPCSPDAKKIEIQSEQPSGSSPTPKTSPAQIEQNIKLCERALREIPGWKDRESLKISTIKRALSTMNVDIKGQKREVIPYVSSINGKNSYGAYQGDRSAACFFDLKDEKFLDYFIAS